MLSHKDVPLIRRPDFVGVDIDSSFVILDSDKGVYIQFNVVAAVVWDLLETAKTERALLESLQDRFDVEPERCEHELRALIERLLELEVIRYAA